METSYEGRIQGYIMERNKKIILIASAVVVLSAVALIASLFTKGGYPAKDAWEMFKGSLVKNEAVIDAVIDGGMAYAITDKEGQKAYGDTLVIFKQETSGSWKRTYENDFKDLKPWKIMLADIDGDGGKEIITAVRKSVHFDKSFRNRLFIFNYSGGKLVKKWTGSQIAGEWKDFTVADIAPADGSEIIFLRRTKDGDRVSIYYWYQFGFLLLAESKDYPEIIDMSVTEEKGIQITVKNARIEQKIILEAKDGELAEGSKSILEQAVDWGNGHLFEQNRQYSDFTLQSKIVGAKEYRFLLEQEDGSWECSLYSIICDTEGQVNRIEACGGGNKEWFSYQVVDLSGMNYAAVTCASHMGCGTLDLYPLDEENGSTYSIDNVIDNNYELMALKDENGYDYAESSVYYDGKLDAEYQDVNADGYTDIVLTGIVLDYEAYPDMEYANTYGELKRSQNCKRIYLYDAAKKQYKLSDEILEDVYKRVGDSYDDTGYLDVNPNYAEGNPRADYDGDGLLDRVYKKFDKVTGNSCVYLYFGNGTKLLLSDQIWGINYKTETADLTGDGVKEILFEQFSTSTKCPNLYLAVFTWQDGSFKRMDIPYYDEATPYSEVDSMVLLPLIMKKRDQSSVGIYQPDSGYRGVITTQVYHLVGETYNEMEHLYHSETDGRLISYQASDMSLVDTEEDGKKAFQFRCYLGDKWCAKSVVWKLEYLNGKWKINGVYQTDPIRIDAGTDFRADLNGDFTEDNISYKAKATKRIGITVEVPYLKINDTWYSEQYFREQFGLIFSHCSRDGIYILDLNTTDHYREIALVDETAEGDPVSYFFRYDGERLTSLGCVTDTPAGRSFTSLGDGCISARKRLSILTVLWGNANWKLNDDGYLEEQPSDQYSVYTDAPDVNKINYAPSDLSLYLSPDLSSDSVLIRRRERLQIAGTDNKNWIEIISDAGVIGWFYLHDGDEVTLPTGEVKLGDIITNLN